uniref:brevican core protein-like n=1 Tax=Pristiophorus japonicus TaxID=55135 RepID=UPI00398EB393
MEPPPYPRMEPPFYPRMESPPYPRMEPSPYPRMEPAPYPRMEPPFYPRMESPPYPRMEPAPYPRMESPPYPRMESPPYPRMESPSYLKMKPLPYPKMKPSPYPKMESHPETIPPPYPEVAAPMYPYLGVMPDSHSEVPVQNYKQSCLPGWTHYNYLSSCYQFFPMKLTWIEAELQCRQFMANGHLASIHWNEHNQLIQNLTKTEDSSQTRMWIGLSDCYEEGLFLWSDGSPLDFVKWNVDQPDNAKGNANGNENCVSINSEDVGNRWSDTDCTEELPFVCTYKLV